MDRSVRWSAVVGQCFRVTPFLAREPMWPAFSSRPFSDLEVNTRVIQEMCMCVCVFSFLLIILWK